ncbi:MAG: hypothetical protein ACOX63_12955 [Christensenellales bacterium]
MVQQLLCILQRGSKISRKCIQAAFSERLCLHCHIMLDAVKKVPIEQQAWKKAQHDQRRKKLHKKASILDKTPQRHALLHFLVNPLQTPGPIL